MRTVELTLASNTIFVAALAPSDTWTAPVRSEKKQSGCVRFSYVPPGSLTPRRYRCQPDLEIATRIDAAEKAANGPIPQAQVNAIRADVLSWLAPSFSSLRHGAPDYAQLRSSCPAQIRTGASDESEMGAFHDLFQPQRETNLRCAWKNICASVWRREVFTELDEDFIMDEGNPRLSQRRRGAEGF